MNTINSVETVVKEIYKCISGANNEERDWETYASLFLPHARVTVIVDDGEKKLVESKSVDEYIDFFVATIQNRAFFEKDVKHRVEYVDSFAVVWSEYEARTSPVKDPVYTGTNCFQLFFNGTRWQIISILWERKFTTPHVFNGHLIL